MRHESPKLLQDLSSVKQGERVRMVAPVEPWMEPMVGWTFLVSRRTRFGFTVKLRAEYQHTKTIVELVFNDIGWFNKYRAQRCFERV